MESGWKYRSLNHRAATGFLILKRKIAVKHVLELENYGERRYNRCDYQRKKKPCGRVKCTMGPRCTLTTWNGTASK